MPLTVPLNNVIGGQVSASTDATGKITVGFANPNGYVNAITVGCPFSGFNQYATIVQTNTTFQMQARNSAGAVIVSGAIVFDWITFLW